MKKKVKLSLPNKKYALSYLKGEKEFQAENTVMASGGSINLFKSISDFPVYHKILEERRKGINLKKGKVPSTQYWAVVGNKVVGRLSLRHRLNKALAIMGGHIGYAIVPSERRKGHGTEILRLGLEKAKKLGIKKALLTCDEKNIGSRKIIEANGGILINKIKENDIIKRRYWISF